MPITTATEDTRIGQMIDCENYDHDLAHDLNRRLETTKVNDEFHPLESHPGEYVEDIDFGMWVCHPEGGLKYASNSFLKLINMTMEQAEGYGWTERLLLDNNDSLERWKECVRREEEWDDEHRILDSDKAVRTLLARGHAVRDESGKITSWVGVHLDITNRKRVEERICNLRLLEGSNRERERIAHRLHDHLQQLLFAAHLQLESIIQDAKYTDTRQSYQRALHIISQAIDSSRNLAVELHPPVLHQFGLSRGLKWLVDFMDSRLGLHVDLCDNQQDHYVGAELSVVIFDSVRELLFNIVKHANVKHAKVIVSNDAQNIQLEVIDQGCGFDAYEGNCSNSSATGLGLSSMIQRTESLGGTCTVDSQVGFGTRVMIRIPCSIC